MWQPPTCVRGSSSGVMASGTRVVHAWVPCVAFALDSGTHSACLVVVLQW